MCSRPMVQSLRSRQKDFVKVKGYRLKVTDFDGTIRIQLFFCQRRSSTFLLPKQKRKVAKESCFSWVRRSNAAGKMAKNHAEKSKTPKTRCKRNLLGHDIYFSPEVIKKGLM